MGSRDVRVSSVVCRTVWERDGGERDGGGRVEGEVGEVVGVGSFEPAMFNNRN